MEIMENQYTICNTPEKISKILQKDFFDSYDIEDKEEFASFCIAMLAKSDGDTLSEEVSDEDITLWYLQKRNVEEKNTTPILRSRFNICFSKGGLDFLKEVYSLMKNSYYQPPVDATAFFDEVIFASIKSLLTNISYVNEDEKCVYFQALKFFIKNKFKASFDLQKFLPENNNEGVCVFLDKINEGKLNCHFCHSEKCTAPEGEFSTSIQSLVEKNIFTKPDENQEYRFRL